MTGIAEEMHVISQLSAHLQKLSLRVQILARTKFTSCLFQLVNLHLRVSVLNSVNFRYLRLDNRIFQCLHAQQEAKQSCYDLMRLIDQLLIG